MKISIQGQAGSACDEAAALLCPDPSVTFNYCDDAKSALQKLSSNETELALLALESPLGTAVKETEDALQDYNREEFTSLVELRREVHHCIMIRKGADPAKINFIASHPIPLKKHADFLRERFPGYRKQEYSDSGAAARDLQKGKLRESTAVIAMPRAAEVFGLDVIERTLPANDGYLTRFGLLAKSEPWHRTKHSSVTETDGILARGHQVASGRGENSPYPAGTIGLQMPYFQKLGLDLSLYYPATLNVSIQPDTFVMQPEITLPNVDWSDRHPPETFSFAPCRITAGKVTARGLIYYPHPETKVRHFQNSSIVEVLAPYIPGLVYGMRLKLELSDGSVEKPS